MDVRTFLNNLRASELSIEKSVKLWLAQDRARLDIASTVSKKRPRAPAKDYGVAPDGKRYDDNPRKLFTQKTAEGKQ